MNPVKYFSKNFIGKDFVCGDIHGCFSKLQEQLYVIGFDEKVDRLFCVGDLVDRGPESQEFFTWLRKPWFHSVRGNHEQMVIDSVREGELGHSSGMHAMNGGMWLYGLSTVEQQCYALEMEEIPLAIEVETAKGLVGIIHAECPLGDWNLFKSIYENNKDRFDAVAMWARTKITNEDSSEVAGLYKLYVGHTPMNDAKTLGNVEYIDTGACFRGGKFTIVQIN
jgi:serine/threonine protein phosphatase 1